MYKYIIQGAGAIGSAIGGSLAKAGFDVTLISREPHVKAIHRQKGIYLTTLEGTELQPINAVKSFSEIDISDNTVVFQTMKASDTDASLDDLQNIDPNTPVICWQNGVDNEEIIGKVFKKVYGGVVRFTATMMTPGETQFAGTGKMILGMYPEGVDALTGQVVKDLAKTDYTSIAYLTLLGCAARERTACLRRTTDFLEKAPRRRLLFRICLENNGIRTRNPTRAIV